MNTENYKKLISHDYSNFRLAITQKKEVFIPRIFGVHLASTGCTGNCIFCIGKNVHSLQKEVIIDEPYECYSFIKKMLKLSYKGEHIIEWHFDGNSSDPVLSKTKNVFEKIVSIIKNKMNLIVMKGKFKYLLMVLLLIFLVKKH